MKDKSIQANIEDNYIVNIARFLRNAFTYKPPIYPEPFVLEEVENDKGTERQGRKSKEAASESLRNSLKILEDNLDYAKKLAGFLEEVIVCFKSGNLRKADNLRLRNMFFEISQRKRELTLPRRAFDNALEPEERVVSSDLSENEAILQQLYYWPDNGDIVFHHFEICEQTNLPKAMLVFLDGMVDRDVVDLAILEPLMLYFCEAGQDIKDNKNQINSITSRTVKQRLPNHIANIETSYDKIIAAINSGDAVLFIDGANEAILLETKGYEHRGVQKAEIEQSVQGSQSAFTEIIQINMSMIRSLMPSNDLVNEKITIGDRIQTACSVVYLKSLANSRLVEEVKRRLKGIRKDYLNDAGMLNHFIEDQPNIFFPKCLQTERPDRTAVHLSEGRVAILMHGSPFAIIVPVTFSVFFHFVEDYSLKIPIANLARIIRLGGAFFSMLLSGLYIAVSYFHQEVIPTDLALAIDVYREKVAFPAMTEILIMEIAFELIREAGLRVPGPLGPTISIVGAIILGQAAVAANLVSPIVVVLISLTGLTSFVIPDYHMASVFRVTRFIFLILAYFLGFVGIGFGVFLFVLLLCYTKSFGVPYMSPWAPKTSIGPDVILRGPIFKHEERPDFLNPKDIRRQPDISREWALDKPGEGEEQK